ncbi:hypothetical protein LJR225_001535 [Phenylobacterium sp. LjRoot225]|uniref:hypothetical protein n=1 Tax=Phenylobacterium sp. LjRoot225 TaxID=3342285 RepID=UPI003ECE0A8C
MTADTVRERTGASEFSVPSLANDRWRVLCMGAALFVVALSIRLILAQRQDVWVDELYHIIAGKSLQQGHGLQLYEGAYRRTPLFTWLISNLSPYYTWNMVVPRLPAAIAGALHVALVFTWLRFRSDWMAAFAAAMFLCLSAVAVQQSAYVRFYSIHALFFWLMATSAYDLFTTAEPAKRIRAVVVGGASALIAMHLQPSTIFGVLAIGCWGVWMLRRSGVSPKLIGGIATLGVVLVAAGVAFMVFSRPYEVARLAHLFSHAEQWNRGQEGDALYYIRYLIAEYPLLISGFILSAVLAYRQNPPLTVLFIAIPATIVIALSTAGMKAPRYILFALPFVFTICGLGVSAGWRFLFRDWSAAGGGRKWFWPALAGFTLAAALSASPGFAVTITSSLGGLKRVVQAKSLLFATPADEPWQSRRAEIASALSGRSVIVTTDEFRMLRYIGAYDVAIAPRYNITGTKKELNSDRRTGRPYISTLKNVQLVYGCYPRGAVLGYANSWPAPVEMDADVQAFLDQHTQHKIVSVNDGPFQVHILTWDHPPAPPSPECDALTARISQGHRPASETIDRILAEPGGGRIAVRR